MTAPLSSPDHAAGPHPEADELADLAEDLLPPADADALRRHLDGCADCRETADALAEVRALLAADEPPAMPADVAARIDAALAAAAREDGAAPAAVPSAPPVPSPPSAVPSPRPSAPTAPPAGPSAATGPGRAARGRRRRALLLGSAAALLALGIGGAFLSLSSSPRHDLSATVDAAGVRAAASAAPSAPSPTPGTGDGSKADQAPGGTVYREEELAAQVRQLLAETATERPEHPAKPSAGAGATAVPPAEGGQGLTGGGRSTPACPPPSTAALLATGRGSWAGAPAELLVYALPGRSDQLDVYLRSPGCGLLLHRTVPAG
ncbi:zf-HC2 domain-containing protein [Kitasatospora sp. NPDC002551]|uniref:zf-HC2 domain-containing protein n=1 Tax=unclassified Kitasatospora TaxID=2633591 RepID=UPI003324FA3E